MSIKQLFNIELPLIQTPMAGVQDSALAIAVCENHLCLGIETQALQTQDKAR